MHNYIESVARRNKMYFRSNIIIMTALSLMSNLVFAGSITDTYTTGDTLTTTTLNNIKSAVNDTGNSNTDLTISANTNWSSTPPTNPNFNNILIETGQTLTVPAGTTIRCAGGFVNNGTLLVTGGVQIGSVTGISTGNSPTSGDHAYAHPGDSYGPASLGHVDNTAVNVLAVSLTGGNGGKLIPQVVAMTSHDRFKFGGGSGAGYDNQGGHGGGLVRVQCAGAIVNTGTIDAQGFNGSNASIGGGGIVILQSGSTIDNSSGTIDVSGGDGRISSSFGGNGGGGGGGIIILISSGVATLGTENISEGLGATGATVVSSTTRRSGGGGGASGGAGGNGGSVGSTGTPSNGLNGGEGYVINITQ